jgi:putative endonuclease
MSYYLYILRCSDDTYYTGITTDRKKRLQAHNHAKTGAKYTRVRRPVTLIYSEPFMSRSEALKREWEVKKLTRREKEKLWQK